MKKQLIILISLLVGASAIIGTIVYLLSFHSVTFTLASPDMTGVIYRYTEKKDPQKVSAIRSSQSMNLQDGDYGYSADNTKYDSSPIRFTVKGKQSAVTIDPAYSRQYLTTLLEPQLPQITSLITDRYGSLLSDYDVHPGVLYGKGEWYGATITEHITPDGNYGDTYRLVLHRKNDTWTIEATPTLVLTTHANPTVPKEIMTAVNDL